MQTIAASSVNVGDQQQQQQQMLKRPINVRHWSESLTLGDAPSIPGRCRGAAEIDRA